METMTQALRQKLLQALQERGIKGCQDVFQEILNEWQGMPMNIAIIGVSGAGKSTLTNAFLGLKASAVGAAAVGPNETTTHVTKYEYPHPNNKKVVFWDMPGTDTTNFPIESYMKKIEADKYDFFLLVTHKRFRVIDAKLAMELVKRNKGYFFIRTHMADEVANHKKSYPDSQEDEVVRKILEKTVTELSKLWKGDPNKMRVFLIDSYEKNKFDFPLLEQELINNFDGLKHEILLLTLPTTNGAMIDKKAECLRSRIWKAAAWSAAIATVPIPGTSFLADIGILLYETKFYFTQFGLDSESLRSLADRRDVTYDDLKATVTQALGVEVLSLGKRSFCLLLTALGIGTAFEAESAVEAAVVCLIPVVGQILAASLSYKTTSWLLKKILDKMHAVAKDLYDV